MPSELILKGFPKVKDVVLLFVDDKVLVGETVRVTDPFELKKLDVERPVVSLPFQFLPGSLGLW